MHMTATHQLHRSHQTLTKFLCSKPRNPARQSHVERYPRYGNFFFFASFLPWRFFLVPSSSSQRTHPCQQPPLFSLFPPPPLIPFYISLTSPSSQKQHSFHHVLRRWWLFSRRRFLPVSLLSSWINPLCRVFVGNMACASLFLGASGCESDLSTYPA